MKRQHQIGGVTVHDEGDGAQTLLLLHGWPDTHRIWDASVAHFRAQYRCLRCDLPGYAPGDRGAWSIAQVSALLKQIVDELNDGQPVLLVTHDWGCFFGGQFLMQHPDRVCAFVCVDVGDPVSLKAELGLVDGLKIAAYQLVLAAAWKMGGAPGGWINRQMAKALGYPCATDAIHANMAWPYWQVWFGRGQPGNAVVPLQPACPTLFLYAQRKPMMFHARAWLDALRAQPGNAVDSFATGHWIMVQRPAEFHARISQWLAEPLVSAALKTGSTP